MKNVFQKAFILLVLIGTFSCGAFASTAVQEIKAQLRPDISVVIDGKTQSFKDAKGNTVYPILYNGTTYLPLRSIGILMNKTVSWDDKTKTATLSEKSAESAQSAQKITNTTQSVSSAAKISTNNNNNNNEKAIYATKTGKKYHYENPCGNGTYYKITWAEANSRGLSPCGKCVLH